MASSSQLGEVAWLLEYDLLAKRWSCSSGLLDLFDLGPQEAPTTEFILAKMDEIDRQRLRGKFHDHLSRPGTFSCTFLMRNDSRGSRRVRYVGDCEAPEGEPKRVHAFMVDVTDAWSAHAAEAVAGVVEHRAGIEQAKGALMLAFGIDDAAAFALLRSYSSRNNIKLATVAERIVAGLCDPQFYRDDPVHALLDILRALEPAQECAASTRN